ncbi:MAG: hypothetical protein SGILL_005281 [Bacillariaceae sp.]
MKFVLSVSVFSALAFKTADAQNVDFSCAALPVNQIQNPNSPQRSACCECVCGQPACMISGGGPATSGTVFCGQPGTISCVNRKGTAPGSAGRRMANADEEIDYELLTVDQEEEILEDAFCDSNIQFYLSIEAIDLLEDIMVADMEDDNITCAEFEAEEDLVEQEIDLYSATFVTAMGNSTVAPTDPPTDSGASVYFMTSTALMAMAMAGAVAVAW